MNYSKEYIGQLIQKARKDKKMKQSQLAEKVGISEKHLSKIETGKNYPALDNFLKMVEVLELSFKDLGITEKIKHLEQKENLYKIINVSSNKQLNVYMDMINTLQKHF